MTEPASGDRPVRAPSGDRGEKASHGAAWAVIGMSAAESAKMIFGAWRIIRADLTGKRCVAVCGECGATRELALPALTSGQIIACPDCWPSNPSSRRGSSSGIPEHERKRHRGGGS
jgi:hypothetical protein